MPISAENKLRYPPDWPQISLWVKNRARWQCECLGQCGRGHSHRCAAVHHGPSVVSGKQVILTTAHLNHIPEDCRRSNLRALCQACHLSYDRAHHAATRAGLSVHTPFTDDGVTYCGWFTGTEIYEGCGELWPCSTVRAGASLNQ